MNEHYITQFNSRVRISRTLVYDKYPDKRPPSIHATDPGLQQIGQKPDLNSDCGHHLIDWIEAGLKHIEIYDSDPDKKTKPGKAALGERVHLIDWTEAGFSYAKQVIAQLEIYDSDPDKKPEGRPGKTPDPGLPFIDWLEALGLMKIFRMALKKDSRARKCLALQIIRKAEEIKLRAERRAGEFLKEMDKAKNQYESPSQGGSSTLKDLGITKNESVRRLTKGNIHQLRPVYLTYIITAYLKSDSRQKYQNLRL